MGDQANPTGAAETFVASSGRGVFISEEPIVAEGMPLGQHVWVRWDQLAAIIDQGRTLLEATGRQSRTQKLDTAKLQALAEGLRGVFCRRGEHQILDAYIALLESNTALESAKDAILLAERVAHEPMSGELFAQLLKLELRRPPKLEWSLVNHPSYGVRYVGRGDSGYRAVVYQPRSGIQTWTWSLYHRANWNSNGEALSALQGAFSAETEYAARCPEAAASSDGSGAE